MLSRRGIWLNVTGTGGVLGIDTCASPLVGGSTIPDTVVLVFSGTCDALALVASNDDAPALCGAGTGTERRSSLSFCTAPGDEYFVWIAPFAVGAQTFTYVATVRDLGRATPNPSRSSAPRSTTAAMTQPPASSMWPSWLRSSAGTGRHVPSAIGATTIGIASSLRATSM
jgi:hypothetical protein